MILLFKRGRNPKKHLFLAGYAKNECFFGFLPLLNIVQLVSKVRIPPASWIFKRNMVDGFWQGILELAPVLALACEQVCSSKPRVACYCWWNMVYPSSKHLRQRCHISWWVLVSSKISIRTVTGFMLSRTIPTISILVQVGHISTDPGS